MEAHLLGRRTALLGLETSRQPSSRIPLVTRVVAGPTHSTAQTTPLLRLTAANWHLRSSGQQHAQALAHGGARQRPAMARIGQSAKELLLEMAQTELKTIPPFQQDKIRKVLREVKEHHEEMASVIHDAERKVCARAYCVTLGHRAPPRPHYAAIQLCTHALSGGTICTRSFAGLHPRPPPFPCQSNL